MVAAHIIWKRRRILYSNISTKHIRGPLEPLTKKEKSVAEKPSSFGRGAGGIARTGGMKCFVR